MRLKSLIKKFFMNTYIQKNSLITGFCKRNALSGDPINMSQRICLIFHVQNIFQLFGPCIDQLICLICFYPFFFFLNLFQDLLFGDYDLASEDEGVHTRCVEQV